MSNADTIAGQNVAIEKKLLMQFFTSVHNAISYIVDVKKTMYTPSILLDLKDSVDFLSPYIELWGESEVSLDEAKRTYQNPGILFSDMVVLALIRSTPPEVPDGTCIDTFWSGSNTANARSFSIFLNRLLDSLRKLEFTRRVLSLATEFEPKGYVGVSFLEGFEPLTEKSPEYKEFTTFIHDFGNKVMVIFARG